VGAFSPGLSVAAVPFYVLGKEVEGALARIGLDDWIGTLAGPLIERGGPDYRWGGEVEIFFVNLLNPCLTAILVGVFFLFSVELGASAASSVVAAFLLGLSTYVALFSSGFLEHPSEALLTLAAFYFLYRDSRSPSWRTRLSAGICLALVLLIRPQAAIGIPALALYSAWTLWRRDSPGRGSVARGIAPVLLPAAAAGLADVVLNRMKFGVWHRLGWHSGPRFGFPSPTAIYAFLLSPGDSIFLFAPLLLLLPWTFRSFFRKHPSEAVAAALLSASYLGFYASYKVWHGLWTAIGPRYLVAIVPVLMLPLAEWIDSLRESRRRAWLAIAPLAAAGFVVLAITISTNFGFVLNHERYPEFRPEYGFLFIPATAPIAAEVRALFAGGDRVDMWLLNVGRASGPGRVLEIALPLAALFAFGVWRIRRALRA